MGEQARGPVLAAGIVENDRHEILIVLPKHEKETPRLWQFPRGAFECDESPEAAIRRIAEALGLTVKVVVGQPPLACEIDGIQVEVRYFFCEVSVENPKPGHYEAIRWIHHAHLREYDFDKASQPVVDWLIRR